MLIVAWCEQALNKGGMSQKCVGQEMYKRLLLAYPERHKTPACTPLSSHSHILVVCFSRPLRPWPSDPKSCSGGIREVPRS